MPPLPLRWGALGRSDRYRCWVWSRVGELGRTTITASARARPGSFLGFDESYHSVAPGQVRRLSFLPTLRGARRRRQRGLTQLPRSHNEKPPDTSTRRRAADAQERAGDGLFSARGCPPSIVGAAAFHFRVRDGNGWGHRAPITSSQRLYHDLRPAASKPTLSRPAIRSGLRSLPPQLRFDPFRQADQHDLPLTQPR